jgi:hypothetical protein
LSEQFSDESLEGTATVGFLASGVNESSCNDEEVDLAFLKDFLVTLQGCNVARFSGYGISVDFNREAGGFDVAPASVGAGPAVSVEPPSVTRGKDGWKNPNLWPQQNGRVLKFDGSFE